MSSEENVSDCPADLNQPFETDTKSRKSFQIAYNIYSAGFKLNPFRPSDDGDLNASTSSAENQPLKFFDESKLRRTFQIDQEFADKFNLSTPWNISHYYNTAKGAEDFHIYLWIAKDIGWSQGYEFWGTFFGIFALVWCFVILYHYTKQKNFGEIYMLMAVMLWLFANYWWMYGEVVNKDNKNEIQARYIFIIALAWFGIYHTILKPCKIFQKLNKRDEFFEQLGLKPRFQFYFATWRQYEHIHTLFWLGKDFAWNLNNKIMWIVFLIPTFFIAIDYMYKTWATKVNFKCT
jgi:hypothetical protein